MKLPNQTHGPVTLSGIDYAANLSQETFAFTAKIAITVNGKTLQSTVMNEGCGGSNNIHNLAVATAVEAYARTLPDVVADDMTLKMDAEMLVSEMVSAALTAHDLKRALTRKILFQREGKLYEYKGKPTDAVRAFLATRGAAVILNDLPFHEALAIYASQQP